MRQEHATSGVHNLICYNFAVLSLYCGETCSLLQLNFSKHSSTYTARKWKIYDFNIFFSPSHLQIIGIKQYLVRPLGLQCSNNNNNNVSKSTATSSSNTSTTSSESGSIASTSYTEPLIPENIIQSAGRSLSDVINDVSTLTHFIIITTSNVLLLINS